MKANEASETHPLQFRDKVDEYLWKEHQILGGCCSSVESLKYSVAREVAERLTNAFIEKAEKFFEDNLTEEGCKFGWSEWTEVKSGYNSIDSFMRAFRMYMKGE